MEILPEMYLWTKKKLAKFWKSSECRISWKIL